jgi:aminoglycoside phosphotransferase (APT) family kinase protein
MANGPTSSADVVLPAPTTAVDAERLISAAFPGLRIDSLRQFGAGWANVVWIVNEGSAPTLFRLPKTSQVAARTRKELQLLPELRAAISTPLPDYRYAAPDGAPGFPHPFGGYPLLPGCPLADADCDATPALAVAVGRFIGALQAFPIERALELGVPGGTADDWRREYDRWYSATRPLLVEPLTPRELATVDRTVAAFLTDERHFRFRPVLAHRDLGPDHLLIDPATGDLTGIIDFEDASIGDPAFDFTGVLRPLPAALSAYAGQVDETFLERVRFYQFIVPLHEVRYGREIGSPEHVANGLSALRMRLDEKGVLQ